MPSSCCSVPGCHQRGGHEFPSDPDQRKKWVIAIRRLGETKKLWTPSKSSVVCRGHFTTEDYVQETKFDASHKKRFIEALGFDVNSVFSLDNLKCDIQLMLDKVGSKPSEQACEGECHKLLQEGHTLNYGCPLVCTGFSNLVHLWHIVPDTADPQNSKCHFHPQAASSGMPPMSSMPPMPTTTAST